MIIWFGIFGYISVGRFLGSRLLASIQAREHIMVSGAECADMILAREHMVGGGRWCAEQPGGDGGLFTLKQIRGFPSYTLVILMMIKLSRS